MSSRSEALEAVAEAARKLVDGACTGSREEPPTVHGPDLAALEAALARLDATPATAADELSAALTRFSAAMGEEHVVISATAKRQYDAAYEREFSREAAKHGATVKFFGPNGWEECDDTPAAQSPTPTAGKDLYAMWREERRKHLGGMAHRDMAEERACVALYNAGRAACVARLRAAKATAVRYEALKIRDARVGHEPDLMRPIDVECLIEAIARRLEAADALESER